MKIIQTQELTPFYREVIFNLWNKEYPDTLRFDSLKDADQYLAELGNTSHYFSVAENNVVTGWATVFEREKEIWFAIIVDGAFHKKGVGSRLLNHIKEQQPVLNGWVIDHNAAIKSNGEKYMSPLAFYLKHGFTPHKDHRLETEKLSAVKINWQA